MSDTAVDCIKYLRDTAIAADTAIGSRIYMSIAPQSGNYPMAVMEIISREESPTQAIGSAMDTYRIQVDVFAKNTTGTSGFDAANAVANALRVAWSRTGNTGDYTNIIDGIQEVDYRTDFLPDLQVFQVSNDYMVRVSPNEGEEMATVSSGTYTPTLSAQDNLSFLSISQAQYLRVGSACTVSGVFTAEVTNGLVAGVFEATLPIVSNVGAIEDVAGVCSSNQNVLYAGSVTGSIANNTALFAFTGEPGTIQYSFIFTYQII